jgi:NAD-dependent dihydropyrimidine dehydrogenase PreA subunit
MEAKTPRVEIEKEECKGCELCVSQCPVHCLEMSVGSINHFGYNYALYKGEGCTGCGSCFYACPEASAVTVYKKVKEGSK